MAEVKDKVVTVESLKALHDYNKETYMEKTADELNGVLAKGTTVLSSYQYGDELPEAGIEGRIFFKRLIKIISFIINSMGSWEAEEGMTWEEWCNSEYNADGFYCENNTVYADGGIVIYDIERTNPVSSSDTIIADAVYNFVI